MTFASNSRVPSNASHLVQQSAQHFDIYSFRPNLFVHFLEPNFFKEYNDYT